MCHVPWVAMCIASLHNCVINERLKEKCLSGCKRLVDKEQMPVSDGTGTHGLSHLSSVPHDSDGVPIEADPAHIGPDVWRCHSTLREKMRDSVKAKLLARPSENRIKRRRVSGDQCAQQTSFFFMWFHCFGS